MPNTDEYFIQKLYHGIYWSERNKEYILLEALYLDMCLRIC